MADVNRRHPAHGEEREEVTQHTARSDPLGMTPSGPTSPRKDLSLRSRNDSAAADEAASRDVEDGRDGDQPVAVVLRGDPWRFSVAGIFFVLSMSNAMQWITFGAIYDEVRNYFNVTATEVNFLSSTYVISYVTIVFLSCKLYEVTGLKLGVLASAIFNAIGAGLKLVALYAWPNAVLLFTAQAFNSFTEVLTIATPPLISNRWFPESERMVANTIMSVAVNFGCGVGVLVPTFFVTPEKQEQKHFGQLFGFQFGLCAGVLLLVIFAFPAKPRYTASHVAARSQKREDKTARRAFARGPDATTATEGSEDGAVLDEKSGNACAVAGATALGAPDGMEAVEEAATGRADAVQAKREVENPPKGVVLDVENEDPEIQPTNVFSTVMEVLRMGIKCPSFALLTVASAAELGLIWAVATVLPQILAPFGVSEAVSGWIGFLNLVAGTIIAPFFMPLIDKTGHNYKMVLVWLAIVLTFNVSVMTLLLQYGPHHSHTFAVVVTFVCWGGIAGLCQNFMMPLMFEYVVELTFPMAESTSAPTLTWSACLANFLLTLIFGEVLGEHPTKGDSMRVFIGATIICLIGALTLLMTFPYTKRQNYERLMKNANARLLERAAGGGAVTSTCRGTPVADEGITAGMLPHHPTEPIAP